MILYKLGKGINAMGLLPMDIEILPPCDDRVFKLILTAPEAKPALMDLVPAVIMRPVTDVRVRNNEIPPGDTEEKAERLDLNCVTDDGSQVDIEMQSSRIEEKPGSGHSNLKGKSIYYLCDLHSSQSSKGKSYDELAQSYQITFCGYTVFPNRTGFINTFSLRHDIDNELLHDAIHIMYVELSKLSKLVEKPVDEMTGLEKWSIFLKYAEDPDYRGVVNKVLESREGLNVAGEVLMSISKDEKERAIFRSRRMYRSDLESNLITAERRGRTEGRMEGRMEGRTEGRIEGITEGERSKAITIAESLLLMDLPIEQIIMATGLTREEVSNLRN
jgi:predicted transposase/invertase (TIGR01784 family)